MKKLNSKLILSIRRFVSFGAGIIVTQNQAVEEDLIIAGRRVVIQAGVKKDVIAAGDEVTVSGEVMGYVIAAARNLTASAPIGNDLFAAGENISLSAPVADNAIMAGKNVNLRPGAVVQHDAMIAGRTIDIEGKIVHDLKMAAREARVAAEVGGSVDARVEKLVLLPGAIIHGN